MNILRWKRKSNNKIRPKTFLLFIFSLIMTTFAWFAYSKVLEPTLNIHISSWDMEYYIGENKKTNPIGVDIPTLYPAMPTQSVTIDIKNNGDTLVDIEYYIKSITIAGVPYELVQEGNTNTTDNYIIVTPSVLEEIPEPEPEPEPEPNPDPEPEGAAYPTPVKKYIAKGAITNDITRFPFTIEIEHSAQVEAATVDGPGEGYLKVIVNWIGDNSELDSEWGYIVGEYLETPGATSAISISLSIDSYQADPNAGPITETLPSTAQTRPYLPTGFHRVAGTTLETGLVIKDSSGNEYVWVEVPKTATVYTNAGLSLDFTSLVNEEELASAYTKIETDLKNYTSSYRTRDDAYSSHTAIGLTEVGYNTLKEKMLKSIYTYGGFYIGRYETGIDYNDEEGHRISSSLSTPPQTPVIKANSYPFNYITCSQAQGLAEKFAIEGYETSLMFGLQWDLVLRYLAANGVNASELTTDSTAWGNYNNTEYDIIHPNAKYSLNNGSTWLESAYNKDEETAILASTGSSSLLMKQNIYDLAGNVSEWTFNLLKESSTVYYGGYGGDYSLEGINSASHFANQLSTTGVRNVGFRVSLIKDEG